MHHRSGQNVYSGDATVCDGTNVRGVLLIHHHLARYSKQLRHGAGFNFGEADACLLLIARLDLHGPRILLLLLIPAAGLAAGVALLAIGFGGGTSVGVSGAASETDTEQKSGEEELHG